MKAELLTSGYQLLHDPVLNKGVAFTEQERDALGLRGLLPPRVSSQEEQVCRALENLRAEPSDLEGTFCGYRKDGLQTGLSQRTEAGRSVVTHQSSDVRTFLQELYVNG
jgi:hypothetical protein